MPLHAPAILVIDENVSLQRVLRVMLSADGCDVAVASTAKEGLDCAATRRFDLVIASMSISDMDVVHLMQRLHHLGRAPVLISAPRGTEPKIVVALEAGADDYVYKPFILSELESRVTTLLRHAARGRPAKATAAEQV